jgi:hypothetical protein
MHTSPRATRNGRVVRVATESNVGQFPEALKTAATVYGISERDALKIARVSHRFQGNESVWMFFFDA